MPEHLRDLLGSAFDYYAERTVERVKGLTDEEYFWEPVEGCWSIRQTDEGYVADWEWPAPDPAPVTTIAWRLVHIISFLTEHGLRSVAFEGGEANWIAPTVTPASANAALYHLDHAIEAWKRDLTAIDDERLWEPMGPEAASTARTRSPVSWSTSTTSSSTTRPKSRFSATSIGRAAWPTGRDD